MAKQWFFRVDGRRGSVYGTYAEACEWAREQRDNGHKVEMGKAPRRDGPAGYASASSWIKR